MAFILSALGGLFGVRTPIPTIGTGDDTTGKLKSTSVDSMISSAVSSRLSGENSLDRPNLRRSRTKINEADYKIFEGINPRTAIVLLKGCDTIWQYLELKEVLRMSTASRFCANLFISQENVLRFLERDDRLNQISQFRITLASEVTIGILRRLLNRVTEGRKAVVSIDYNTGRVKMDIGSAFQDKHTYLADEVISSIDEVAVDGEVDIPPIDAVLEAYSCDEYDDFNPTHPALKVNDKGTCYFSSSDFEDFAKKTLKNTHTLSGLELWTLDRTGSPFVSSTVNSSTSLSSLNSERESVSRNTSKLDLNRSFTASGEGSVGLTGNRDEERADWLNDMDGSDESDEDLDVGDYFQKILK